MTTKEQFESLIRVLNLALNLTKDLESKSGDFVEVPFYESLEDLAKSLEIKSQTKNKE